MLRPALVMGPLCEDLLLEMIPHFLAVTGDHELPIIFTMGPDPATNLTYVQDTVGSKELGDGDHLYFRQYRNVV